jgi:hypothetical protein
LELCNSAGKGKGKGKEKEKVAHKRQISEATPRNERNNRGLSRPEAGASKGLGKHPGRHQPVNVLTQHC